MNGRPITLTREPWDKKWCTSSLKDPTWIISTRTFRIFRIFEIFGCFHKWKYPQIINFNWIFPYKPTMLGTPILGNHHFELFALHHPQMQRRHDAELAVLQPQQGPRTASEILQTANCIYCYYLLLSAIICYYLLLSAIICYYLLLADKFVKSKRISAF